MCLTKTRLCPASLLPHKIRSRAEDGTQNARINAYRDRTATAHVIARDLAVPARVLDSIGTRPDQPLTTDL